MPWEAGAHVTPLAAPVVLPAEPRVGVPGLRLGLPEVAGRNVVAWTGRAGGGDRRLTPAHLRTCAPGLRRRRGQVGEWAGELEPVGGWLGQVGVGWVVRVASRASRHLIQPVV
ncbi:hypothetical protein GCM10010452_47630 [Crossiella cryophila]